MSERTGRKYVHQATGAIVFDLASPNGVVDTYEVELDGIVIGVIHSYEGYVDKKRAGSRVVASRRTVKLWSVRAAGSQCMLFGYRNRIDAITTLIAITK